MLSTHLKPPFRVSLPDLVFVGVLLLGVGGISRGRGGRGRRHTVHTPLAQLP